MRALRVLQLEAEAPVVRILASEARKHAAEAREGGDGRLGEGLGRDEGRARAARGRMRPGRRACRADALGRARPQLGTGKAERVEDGRLEVFGEGHLRPFRQQLAEQVEAGVRVDASLARPGDRHLALEREPRCVGEQMAHRRARAALRARRGRGPLLRRDKHRVGGQELRDGGPAEDDVRGAARGRRPPPGDDGDRRGRDRPRVDLLERLHGRRY